MASILVAYASKHGSTQDIAGILAEALREEGVDVDLVPAHDVRSVEPYSAAIVGAALYNHKWHGDAVKFVSRHREALQRIPVAVFAVGPVNDNAEEFEAARQQLEGVLARWDWLTPASKTVFGGRFDPSTFRFPGASRIMAKAPASDIVDPAAIRTWARTLPAVLAQPALR